MTGERLADFEARLAQLKQAMEIGLVDRARSLRDLARRVGEGEVAARLELKLEAHKLRGVAGTYGHGDLTDLAARLEQQAPGAEAGAVARLALALSELAEAKSSRAALPLARPVLAQATRAGPRLRVLAIDDDAVTQRLLLLTLQQVGGFEATIVSSASKALALLQRHVYDVVVSDAMMPDMNGIEFQRAAHELGVSSPIVILSAASPDELGWPGRREGGPEWLRKPFRPSELVKDILRIAARAR